MTLNYFRGDTFDMSIIEVIWSVGMLIGGGFMGLKYMKLINKPIAMNCTTIIMGVCFLASGLLPISGFIAFATLTAITGFACAIYWGSFTVILQTNIEKKAMGRVFSIFDSISLMPTLPGLLATGFIAQSIGLMNAFRIAGTVIILVGVVSFLVPAIMQLEKRTPKIG